MKQINKNQLIEKNHNLSNINAPTWSKLAIFIIIIGISIIIFTSYIGSADIVDYAGVAKFFAGDYQAKIRSSHSYSYGFMNFPLVKIAHSFILMKIMSIVWIILIVLSLFYISKKDKRFLLIALSTPIFWYMAPWISPIQISSLFFLWAYYFIREYDEENKVRYLIYSALFAGISLIFWDPILLFIVLLIICFLYNKKLFHAVLFAVFLFIGLAPRLILDQILFNFAFYSLVKTFAGGFVNSLWKGVTGERGHASFSLINSLFILVMLPLYSYLILNRKNYKQSNKSVIFIILSVILILKFPQIRYTLAIVPIILLNVFPSLTNKQFKIQITYSLVISLLVLTPYLMQVGHTTNAPELQSFIINFGHLEISDEIVDKVVEQDLINISHDFPNQTFVVGNLDDSYMYPAMAYWGEDIKEFVSIQDYNLAMEGKAIIFEKEFHPIPNINDRREIWIKGGISKTSDDKTDYNAINFAISEESEIDLNGFKLIKSYKKLNVFDKRIN